MSDRDLMKFWKEFAETGKINKNVKPYIAKSWLRSKEKHGIDIYDGGYGIVEESEKFQTVIDKNRDLINVTYHVMEKLYNTFKGTGTVVVLSDKDDYILEVLGDGNFRKFLSGHNLKKGAKWGEEVIGTNGMSLSMELGRPVQTLSAEHYCKMHHNTTCSCAPIRNKSGNIIGALSIINKQEIHSRHSLGMVMAAALVIETGINLINTNMLIENAYDSITEGILIINNDLKIKKANRSARRILNYGNNEILGYDIVSIIPDLDISTLEDPMVNKNYKLHSKRGIVHCVCNIYLTYFNRENTGFTLTFKKQKDVNKFANEVVRNKATYVFEDIITKNKMMKNAINHAKHMAKVNCNLLITGESGTGKELFVQSIHNASNRSEGPFIAVNCAALPKDLVESELFGYEEGAFTGAKKEGFPGKFELADGGTIFLDEIGELPIDVQSKLLRVLDNHKVSRIGGMYERPLDVRVISATNRDLEIEVKKRNFRLDLFYRINVVTIEIPPLRKRQEDIEYLAYYFLDKYNRKIGKDILSFSDNFIKGLQGNSLDGNVRQLQNIVSRACYLCEESIITSKYLPSDLKNQEIESVNQFTTKSMDDIEKEMIINNIIHCDGNITQAAERMEISRSTMYRKIKKYDIKHDNINIYKYDI